LIAAADGEGDAERPAQDTLDLLEICEAMGTHFHEHQLELLRWPWKLFCAKWVRLLEAGARERARQEQRRVEQELRELERAHAERW
jgi:hypothetical protein